VFWMTDLQKRRMIYVSPGYEIIWGRTRESLYAEPHSWMEAVHPDDRERVRQAALTKQAGGEYDEEYRIVRPEGEVRWIRDRAYPVRDEGGQVYRIVGIAEDITERKRLEAEILDVSHRERRRIGQDIHDGLCQHLAGTAFAMKALEQTLATADSPLTADAREITRLVSEAITEARHIARGLSPVELEPQGLMTALEQLAANVSSMFGVNCTFSCQQAVRLRDNEVAVHLYRIAQEAVTNAVKHGRPKRIWVALTSVNGRVNLTVEDDGVGIAENPETNGMGLQIMAYRARMMGGLLDIQGQEGGGTIVTCSVEDGPPHGNGANQS
jgi:PAS domain S-box-containing protein